MEDSRGAEDTIPQEPILGSGRVETLSVRGMTAAVEQQRQLLPPIGKDKRAAWKLAHKEIELNENNQDC